MPRSEGTFKETDRVLLREVLAASWDDTFGPWELAPGNADHISFEMACQLRELGYHIVKLPEQRSRRSLMKRREVK